MASSSVHVYDIGDLVILKNGTFKDGSDTAVDPPIINVKVVSPNLSYVTYTFGMDAEVEKLDTGVYRCSIKPMIPGMWHYRWEAQDPSASIVVALEGAEEHRFSVRPSAFVYT